MRDAPDKENATTMAKRRLSYEELKERVDELEDENQALNEKIDSIMDIVSSDDDEEDEDES
jgi:predicted nuclease with TOPRIM domain